MAEGLQIRLVSGPMIEAPGQPRRGDSGVETGGSMT